jgi:ribose transport system substrate-binding protein
VRKLFGWSALVLVLAASACGGGAGTETAQKTLTLAVIPKGTSHVFWQSIHAGAQKAATELGVDIIWRGPLREDDRAAQIKEVEGFITRGVSGIVLAPLDDVALAAPVAEAARSKIPTVVIDSGLKSDQYVSFVATDNLQGGRLAGEGLASLLPQGGKVVLLRYTEGSASTTEREAGFLEVLETKGNIDVVTSNQYGGAVIEEAYAKSEAILSRYKRADGSLGIDGIFCPNESTTVAMMGVLQANGWAGKVRFVGFDASDKLVQGMRDGVIDALVLQDPVKMGYLGVATMVKHLKGEAVEKRIDTGVRLVKRAEMDQPDVQELLHPDLSRWLKP